MLSDEKDINLFVYQLILKYFYSLFGPIKSLYIYIYIIYIYIYIYIFEIFIFGFKGVAILFLGAVSVCYNK